ncbi:MAG: hypothetical protein M3Q45_02705 [Chloroflexota bacterium]|nr:hypothetical protein [Chloroflexota bacterium]
MTPQPDARLEEQLRRAAAAFAYPPTPNMAAVVGQQFSSPSPSRQPDLPRLAWAAFIALIVLLTGLLAVPPVRAAIVDFLQIGAVRIWLTEPTPTSTPVAAIVTPNPTPLPLTSVLDLAGETTLAAAAARVDFPIRLPTYPADLGAPDRVYRQNLDGPAVVLVWLDKEPPDQVRMSLHLLSSAVIAGKMGPKIVATPKVHDQFGLWIEGPYLLVTRSGDWELVRLIEGYVLVWTEGDITYRLETSLPLAEAVRVAESLQ